MNRLFFLLLGGILGSGIFFMPYELQNFGMYSLLSVSISCFALMLMAFVFAENREQSIFCIFERQLGIKFVQVISFCYWFASWSATIVVVNTLSLYFSDLFDTRYVKVFLILTSVFINFQNQKFVILSERIINIIKVILFVLMPLVLFCRSDFSIAKVVDFKHGASITNFCNSFSQTVWCFVGVEILSINKTNKKKKVIFWSFFVILLIYLLNFISVFGVFGFNIPSKIFYLYVFQEKLMFFFMVFVICFGSLNLWIMGSAEIATETAKLGFMPRVFINNKNSILLSSLGLIPLSFLSSDFILMRGISYFSNIFLLFYFLYFLVYFKENKSFKNSILLLVFGFFFILSFFL